MGFKGSLDTFNLADVFQNLSLNQQTGTLRLVAGSGACRNVYFASGHIKYLDRGDDKPLIPAEAFAVRGLASREQLDHAIAKASETGRPVGECLIDIGACSREQVDALFQHQIEEDIYELFGWEKADFEFTEGDPGAGRFADQVGFTKNVKIQVSGLIMEAARRIDEWERIRQQIPSPKEVYVFEESAAKAVAGGEIELDPIERRVFSLMDGIRDVGDLIADSCLSAFEVAKALSGFLQNGMIRPARVEELRAAAEKCEKAGERVKCIKLYERILAVGGEDVGIRKALAEACVAAGNAEKAAIHMNVLAEAALKEGDEEKALGVLRRIVQLIPRHAPSRERLAEIYARRDQKREAIINYQELCSIYQEGGRIAEARAACVRALELDPSHVDIRNELVKLCLLDNDRAAACRELEIMGDLYARAGRVKQAAETYRRILSMDHSLTQVKTKLSNVLLSEDEKRQRRVIIRTVLAAIALAILAAGGLGLYEYVNFREYERRMDAARDMELEAEGLLRAGKYDAAAARYREAAGAAAAARTLNSPFLALDRKAGERESKLLADARDAEEKAAEARAREQERIKSLISDIEKHEKAYELAEAISKCRDVIGSEYAEGPQKDSCSEKLAELTKKKREIEDFLSFMRVGTPDPAEEYRKKTEFLGKYPDHPECPRVRLPLTISALTGEADVVFDGALVGVAGERPLRIEYDPGKRHALEVRREGYRSYKRSFQTLETWELKVALARETAWKFSAKLNPNETIAAETGFSAVDRVFFIGTSEGAVVAVREGMDAELWRVAGRGGLGGEVVGKVHFVREGAADGGVLIFGVQRGEVVAYSLASGVKSPVWSASCAEPLQAGLSVEPVTLFGGTHVVFVPEGRQISAYRAATGQKLWTSPRAESVLTTAPLLAGSFLWVGGKDGSLRGYNVSNGTLAARVPAGQFGIRSGIAFDRASDTAYLGNDGGQMLCFDARRRLIVARLEVGGEVLGGPVLGGGRVFFGTSQGTVLSVDASNILDRGFTFQADGAVRWPPLATDRKLYFGTDKGVFYCVDRGRGSPLWEYVTDERRPCIGQPILSGNRVYFVTADGTLYGFQEDR